MIELVGLFVSHNRQATVLTGTAVLKRRMPSAPIATSPLPLEASAATIPKSVTNGSPVTNVHCEPGSAWTR